jgi:cell division protein FtsB
LKVVKSDMSRSKTKVNQARQLGELEAENARLKDAVAVLTVDKLILKAVVEENGRGEVLGNVLPGDEQ